MIRARCFFKVDSRCHTLRYENLVRVPDKRSASSPIPLGEPFDSKMLDTSKSASTVNAAN